MVKEWIGKTVGIFLITAGIGLFLYPDISEWFLEQQTTQYVDDFQAKYKESHRKQTNPFQNAEDRSDISEIHEPEDIFPPEDDPLYQEILTYNREIYENEQEGFLDAWSYEQTPISLEGLEDGKFGYMEIPVLDIILPLYIGASASNMAKGAAVLGQTSIPIGGESTNSVIAAHRGWSTGSFLKDIEEVSVGDAIYITNPWERLVYQVEAIDIVYPDDSDAVKIQEGKDMITICTCHPYMSQGKYRYLLYCIRNENMEVSKENLSSISVGETEIEKEAVMEEQEMKKDGGIVASNGIIYESSGNTIKIENLLRRGSAFVMLLIVFLSFAYVRIRDRKKKSIKG